MKILLVITGLKTGGAERQVCDLADSYASTNHEVVIVSLTGVSELTPQNSNVKVIQISQRKTLFGIFTIMMNLVSIVRKFGPDVVHSHLVHANIICRLLRLIQPIPKLISTAHSTKEGGRFWCWLYKITDNIPDLSTNVSKAGVVEFERSKSTSKGNMIAVYNGIDLERFRFDMVSRHRKRSELSIGERASVLLAVGRITAAKDYNTLLRAFAKIASSRGDIHLVIIGDGELEGELKRACASLDAAKNVHLLGRRIDVPAWLSAADVFVLSSAWEGFGLVVAEAMASELPVVATDCGGVAEVVGNLWSLAPVGDSATLADNIGSILSMEPSEKASKVQAAKNRVHTFFGISNVAAQWLQLYKNEIRTKA